MTKIQITLLCLTIFSPFLFSQPFLNETQSQSLIQDLEKLLAWNLQQQTNRVQAKLALEYEEVNETGQISLGTRSQRDTLCFLRFSRVADEIMVRGRVLYEKERTLIENTMHKYFPKEKLSFLWSVGPMGWAISKKSLVDLYVFPREEQGDNLASQFLYGTPVTILEMNVDGSFFRVQSQDDFYIGWMKASDLKWTSQKEWDDWRSLPSIYLNKAWGSYPTGARLGLHLLKDGKYWARDVDGQVTEISSDLFLSPFENYSTQSILTVAQEFLPKGSLATQSYLWGGTSPSYLDCSGFVQLTFRFHNILLPRDADQQQQYNWQVSEEEMKEGDLIFFSRNGHRPTHVGIYLGEGKYIHCSPSGNYSGVKINDLEGTSDYDKLLRKLYFGAARVRGLK